VSQSFLPVGFTSIATTQLRNHTGIWASPFPPSGIALCPRRASSPRSTVCRAPWCSCTTNARSVAGWD
jgi:hypothetical protein